MVQQNGTIAAIATPPGVGGIAVVRISGSGAYSVAEAVFRPKIRIKACVPRRVIQRCSAILWRTGRCATRW